MSTLHWRDLMTYRLTTNGEHWGYELLEKADRPLHVSGVGYSSRAEAEQAARIDVQRLLLDAARSTMEDV